MQGLLNARGGFDDPITMGLLGASQALLTPMSQGGGLGAAFGAFPAAQQAAEQRRMRELLQMAQMGNLQSETEYRNAQMAASREEAMRKAQLEAGRSALYGKIAAQGMPTFRDESAAITGVNPTADYVAPQNRGLSLTPQLAAEAARLGIKPEELSAVFNAGLSKVARTIEGAGANGSPETMQLDDYGRLVGKGIAKPVETKFLNTGGSQVAYNPFTGPTGLSIANTMTPGEVASNRVAQGNLGVAQARLAFDRDAGKWTNLADLGLQVNMATGETRPITAGGVPLGAKQEKGTEGERGAAGYGSRMVAAEKNIAAYDSVGRPTLMREAAANTPFTGGRLGPYVRTEDQQLYRQAQEEWVRAKLRKESGAAIPSDEMEREIQTYFPMPGEPDSVALQKAGSRQQAIAAMQTAAGPIKFPTIPASRQGPNRVMGAVINPTADGPSGGRPPLSSFGAP